MLEIESSTTFKKNELYANFFNNLKSNGLLSSGSKDYSTYADDPIGFCTKELGYSYAPKIEEMMLSVLDNQITLAKSCNAYGKTHGIASIIAWYLRCKDAAKIYMTAAPPIDNLTNILWAELTFIVRQHPDLFKDLQITHLRIGTPINPKLDTQPNATMRWCVGLTIPSSGTDADRVAKFSGKHDKYQLMVFDEGDAIPDTCYEGAETCNTGDLNRTLITYNPRQKAGYTYRTERDGSANLIQMSAFDHPNVIEGKEIIPDAVSRQKTVDRINKYCRLLVDGEQYTEGEYFDLPDFLVGATAVLPNGGEYPPLKAGRYKIKEPIFSYMVLGEYPAVDSSQLISETWIIQARQRWDEYVSINGEVPPKFERTIAGLDVAEYGVDSNSMCFRTKNYVAPFVRWGGLNIAETADKAVTECSIRNVSITNVDGNGVGAGVAPLMKRKGVAANNLKSQESPTLQNSELGDFKILRDQLCWAVRLWLENEPAMLPPNDNLIEELLVLRYVVKNGKVRITPKDVIKDKIKRSPDDFDALSLTLYPDVRVFS